MGLSKNGKPACVCDTANGYTGYAKVDFYGHLSGCKKTTLRQLSVDAEGEVDDVDDLGMYELEEDDDE